MQQSKGKGGVYEEFNPSSFIKLTPCLRLRIHYLIDVDTNGGFRNGLVKYYLGRGITCNLWNGAEKRALIASVKCVECPCCKHGEFDDEFQNEQSSVCTPDTPDIKALLPQGLWNMVRTTSQKERSHSSGPNKSLLVYSRLV